MFIDSLHRGVDALARLPGLGGLVRRQAHAVFLANRDRNLFYGVHDTFDDAAQAAAACGRAGYDNSESARLYTQRTRIDAHDYPALYWLSRSLGEGHRSVFDVGGATGIKFIAFRDLLQTCPDLKWTVQDVPAMVSQGREEAQQRGDDPRLRFTDRFDDGEGCDLLYASGVLQYLPATLGDLLTGWRRLPRRIVINTAAIHPQHEFFTVNSLGTAFCPYRVQTQASLIRGLTALGYRLRESWTHAGKAMHIPFHPERCLDQYSGYCLDLNRS
jgi:putative methyltransferase (TIGR04325 family)